MNSEKVKEIKKALEFCVSLKKGCRDCPYSEIGCYRLLKDILTYINELESENKKLEQHKRELQGGQQDLTRRIAELEKENKDYYDRLNNVQTYIDNHEEVWKGNTKIQLKLFAERLKIECVNKIHETLKDFMGEK